MSYLLTAVKMEKGSSVRLHWYSQHCQNKIPGASNPLFASNSKMANIV